jgi:hypothetical protein
VNCAIGKYGAHQQPPVCPLKRNPLNLNCAPTGCLVYKEQGEDEKKRQVSTVSFSEGCRSDQRALRRAAAGRLLPAGSARRRPLLSPFATGLPRRCVELVPMGEWRGEQRFQGPGVERRFQTKGPQLEELYRALVDFTLRATDNLVLER